MMNAKKRCVIIVYTLLLCLTLAGCKTELVGHTEIDEITFPGVVAIDLPPNNKDLVRLSVSPKKGTESKSSGGGGGDSESKSSNILQSEGKTVFEANRIFTSYSEKDIHWGQNEYIIIGEDIAKDDVLKNLDYFIRNHENRLTVSVAVAKNSTGEDIIKAAKSKDSTEADKLKNLFQDYGSLSLSQEIRLSDFIEMLNNKYAAAYLPAIQAFKKQSTENKESESNDKLLELDGFAIFKNTKLLGFIIDKQARGLNWVTNNISSAILVPTDSTGENVSLEVIDSNANIKTKIEEDTPTANIKLKMSSNVVEMQGRSNIFNEENINSLAEKQKDIVKEEVESAIAYAQKNNVDFLGISDKLMHQHPIKWNKLKDKWDEIFPTMKIEIEVESKINRVYNIKEPVRKAEENE